MTATNLTARLASTGLCACVAALASLPAHSQSARLDDFDIPASLHSELATFVTPVLSVPCLIATRDGETIGNYHATLTALNAHFPLTFRLDEVFLQDEDCVGVHRYDARTRTLVGTVAHKRQVDFFVEIRGMHEFVLVGVEGRPELFTVDYPDGLYRIIEGDRRIRGEFGSPLSYVPPRPIEGEFDIFDYATGQKLSDVFGFTRAGHGFEFEVDAFNNPFSALGPLSRTIKVVGHPQGDMGGTIDLLDLEVHYEVLPQDPGTAPTIDTFSAAPTVLTVAQPTLLSWSVSDATSCSIDNGVGAVACDGSTVVTPGASLSYTLTAIGDGANTSAAVSLSVGASGRFVYASNRDDDTVSMLEIDDASGQLSAIGGGTVASGNEPLGLAADPGGRYVYVADFSDDAVRAYSVGSTGQLTSLGAFAADGTPGSVVVDATGRFVYAANQITNTISMYTIGSTGALTSQGTVASGNFPIDVATDPLGRYVYVTNAGDRTVSMYSIETDGTLTANGSPSASATGGNPRGISVDPTGRYVYVANGGDTNSISMYTIAADGTLTSIGEKDFPDPASRPTDLATDPSGRYLYAVDTNSAPLNHVHAFSITDGTGMLVEIGTVNSNGIDPNAIAVDPGGDYVYVITPVFDELQMFAIEADGSLTPLAPSLIGIGSGAEGIVISR